MATSTTPPRIPGLDAGTKRVLISIGVFLALVIFGSNPKFFFGLIILAILGWFFYKRLRRAIGFSSSEPKVVSEQPITKSSLFTIPNQKQSMRIIGIAIGVVVVILVATRIFVVVPAGSVGVYQLFGRVSPNELRSGLHIINPLGGVTKMSVRTEQYTMSIVKEEGNRKADDSIDALTKEGLKVNLDLTVLFRLDAEKASDVYTGLGRDYAENFIRPQVRSVIREVVSQYDASALYSTKREEATDAIQKLMSEKLTARGITLEDTLLRNVILPEKLSNSIQEKLQAEQQAQQYEFILQKESKEAERKRIEAAGQRDSQKIIADGLTPNYLNYLYIQNLKDNKGTIYVPTSPTTGMPLYRNTQ